jgi:Helix-turn-helix domain
MDESTGAVLTVEEVAACLRTDVANVLALLEDGTLVGFKIAGEWRILSAALADFLRREMEASQQAALPKRITDPRTWVRDPQLLALLNEREHEEGTFGAWVMDAARAEEKERDTLAALEAAWAA